MSETDDNLTPEEGRRVLPAEYVLGVLGAEERRAFAERLEREPDLVREVAFWEERLGVLADGIRPVAPPVNAWSRIEAAIAPPPAAAPQPMATPTSTQALPVPTGLWQSLAFWRGFGMSAATVAAAAIAALGYLGIKPPPQPQQGTPMLATLGQTSGQPGFVAALGSDGRSMIIVPASLLTADQQSLELWLIPAGDRPHSLGLIAQNQPVRLNVPADLVSRINTEATLAVTREPLGGSPTGQPTSQPIAVGKLTNL
jgi:anti-sigma-K factor RskA